jgi:outer membrane protein
LKELFPEIPLSTEEIDKISESFLPQIKSASLKTNAALFGLKVAESGWFPKLTMSGALKTGYSSMKSNITQITSYNSETIGYLNGNSADPVIGMVPNTIINKQNDPLSDQFKNNFNQVIGVTLSVPIFNNLQVKTNIEIAKINVLSAKLNEQQTKNDLRKSIETAYTNQVSAGKKLIATEEQMALEKRTYSDMEKKFNVGAINATDFLIEKNNFNKVSMSLIQAKYDYVLKTKMVDFYLGKPLTF